MEKLNFIHALCLASIGLPIRNSLFPNRVITWKDGQLLFDGEREGLTPDEIESDWFVIGKVDYEQAI